MTVSDRRLNLVILQTTTLLAGVAAHVLVVNHRDAFLHSKNGLFRVKGIGVELPCSTAD
jgi:hypothetical protein